MINYEKLTRIQKRCVDTFCEFEPSLLTADTIERPMIVELFEKAREKFDGKFGFPSWLERNGKVGRGLYPWPGPGASGEVEIKEVFSEAEEDEFEKQFMQEMREAGVI